MSVREVIFALTFQQLLSRLEEQKHIDKKGKAFCLCFFLFHTMLICKQSSKDDVPSPLGAAVVQPALSCLEMR